MILNLGTYHIGRFQKSFKIALKQSGNHDFKGLQEGQGKQQQAAPNAPREICLSYQTFNN